MVEKQAPLDHRVSEDKGDQPVRVVHPAPRESEDLPVPLDLVVRRAKVGPPEESDPRDLLDPQERRDRPVNRVALEKVVQPAPKASEADQGPLDLLENAENAEAQVEQAP